MKETDIYEGVRKYFEERGFTVRAEVKDMDVCAVREGLLVGIELKRNFSSDLLIQGAMRQKVCDLVYIAVPKPKRVRKDRAFTSMLYLLRRLELGLLYVDVVTGEATEVLEPTFYELDKARRTMLKKRAALLKEFGRRTISANTGGSSKKRLLTAYREESLKAVAYLRTNGTAAPKDLKAIGIKPGLFRDNFYGWFMRVDRGVYALDEKKAHDYKEYEEHIERFRSDFSDIGS